MVVTSRARKWPSISAVLSIYLSYLRCKMNGASLARHVLESHRACGCFAVHTRVHNHGFFLPNVAHRSGRYRLASVGHHVRPDATGSGKPLLAHFCGTTGANGRGDRRARGWRPGACRSEHVFHSRLRCRRTHRSGQIRKAAICTCRVGRFTSLSRIRSKP